ncbi:MAG: TIGR02281 family clan AA aspartic protease [Halieaceae bacterium]
MTAQHHPQKRMGTVMQAIAWLILMVLLVFFFSDLLGKRENPNQSLETQYSENGVREVVLKRNRAGHYVASGAINGRPVVFMLDTGATGVAIPDAVARKLAIPRGQPFATRTANGVATSYSANLDTVSVGDIELQNVRAGITPGLTSEQVLLGMSFLRHIEFTQRGDTLILRQFP